MGAFASVTVLQSTIRSTATGAGAELTKGMILIVNKMPRAWSLDAGNRDKESSCLREVRCIYDYL